MEHREEEREGLDPRRGERGEPETPGARDEGVDEHLWR